MEDEITYLFSDPRFIKGLSLFNSGDWYLCHDLLEELWHETYGSKRQFLQGLLQIAVAQFHLQNGNKNGAKILYGEALGRLKNEEFTSYDFDLEKLIICIRNRLRILQENGNPDFFEQPILEKRF